MENIASELIIAGLKVSNGAVHGTLRVVTHQANGRPSDNIGTSVSICQPGFAVCPAPLALASPLSASFLIN